MTYRRQRHTRRTGATVGGPTGVYEIDNPYDLNKTLDQWTPDKPKPGKVPVVEQSTGKQGTAAAGENAVITFAEVEKAMRLAGASARIARYAALQAAHETGGFTSNVMKQNGNYSGIKYAKQKGATKGTLSPEGNNFARYANIDDWARDMMRLLSFGARPVDATSINDYAARLKKNGYYGASESSYAAALNRWANLYGGYKEAEAAVKNPEVKPAEKPEADSFFEWISDNPIKTLGIAAAVMVLLRR